MDFVTCAADHGAAVSAAVPSVNTAGAPLSRSRALQDLLKQPLAAAGGRGALLASVTSAISERASASQTAVSAPKQSQPTSAASDTEPVVAGEGGDRRLTRLE